jgi:vancomycin permeability regulator SanA
MRAKVFAAAVVITALATPALADFWIVQDSSTKKCTIVEKKPTDTKVVVVGGDGKVYKTRAEAETEMKTVTVCTTR